MTVDPSDPETFTEEDEPAADGPEVPEADAAEQHTEVRPERDQPLRAAPEGANEADAAEQARTVSLDEDDYR